jgi:hypothetical protein
VLAANKEFHEEFPNYQWQETIDTPAINRYR